MSDTPKYFVPGNSIRAITNERVGHIGKIIGIHGNWYNVEFPDAPGGYDQYDDGDGYTANTKREAEKVSRHYRNA